MSKLQTIFLTLIVFVSIFIFTEYPKFRDFNDDLMRIYFLDVGQGDASLIKLPSRKLVLIDTGPSGAITETISSYLPFTQNKIDLVILTHSHADHIRGFIDILDNYDIGCVAYNMDDSSNSETEKHLREKLKDQSILVVSSESIDECFSDPDVLISNYHMYVDSEISKKVAKNQNLESVVTFVKYGAFEALFTADAELEVQQAIISRIEGDIEVIKVPHQGSRDGLYPPLLQKLLPDYAVFSVGHGNSYGHPHREVVAEYTARGINSARTDLNGTIQVSTDGRKWEVVLEKP